MDYNYGKKLNIDEYYFPIKLIWFALFSLVAVHEIMPVVGRMISDYLTTYFLLIVVGLIFFYFIVTSARGWISMLFPLILITVIELLNRIATEGDIVICVYGALLGFTPIMIAFRLQSVPFKQKKLFFRIVFIAVVITIITSIIGLASNPGAARYLATVSDSNEADYVRYGRMNIGGFIFTYMLLTIYPAIICYLRETNVAMWKRIVFIALMAGYYISAEYMTGLMGFIIISTLWLMPRELDIKKMTLILGMLLVVFLILKTPISNLFYYLSGATSSETLSERFLYMADSLTGVKSDSDVGIRKELIESSWKSFITHPILGTWRLGNKGAGGHSYILDFLCKYGLAGAVMQVSAYKCIFKNFISKFKNTTFFGYAVCSMYISIFLSIVNTGNHWFELALVVPIMLGSIMPEKMEWELAK